MFVEITCKANDANLSGPYCKNCGCISNRHDVTITQQLEFKEAMDIQPHVQYLFHGGKCNDCKFCDRYVPLT